jgi:hypothetical protein
MSVVMVLAAAREDLIVRVGGLNDAIRKCF